MSLRNFLHNKPGAYLSTGLTLLGAFGLLVFTTSGANAACTPLPTSGGAASFTITAPEAGSYRLWTRLYSPASGSDSVYARVDDTHCQLVVGDSALAQTGEFTWIDYQKGQPTDKLTIDLAAGDHTITYAGLDGGVGIDKVLLLTDMSCVPEGTGDNCLVGAVSTSESGASSPTPFNEAMGKTGERSSSYKVLFTALGAILLLAAAGAAVWLFKPHWWRAAAGPVLRLFGRPSKQALPFDPTAVVVMNHEASPKYRRWIILGTISFAAIGSALVIYAVASPTSLSFMMTNANLTGSAKVVSNDKAIGDKMVEFSVAPGGSTSSGSGSSSGGGSGSSGSGGGSSSGGSSSGGGSSSAQSCPAYPSFPDASCTGVPSGVVLSAYTGPCTITANNTVIDSKTVNCSLDIEASNVQIKNSRINGTVNTPNGSLAYSFTITDSEVIAPQATAIEQTGIAEANFTALRVEVTGGNRGIYCRKNCTVRDSWVHGTNIAQSPRIHASAIRQSQGGTIVHNRLHCSAEDTPTGGGCSANLTGYGDFEPVQDNLIEKNLFVATPGGACAYGGSSGDDGSKPYGDQASNIVFKDNVFQRGSENNCGYYFPITDFDSNRPGNQWTNNKWEDGATVPPAN